MNAVEIEEAVSALVAEPFNAAKFPFAFLTAYGAKKTTVDRLRRGGSNQSDVGGVLLRVPRFLIWPDGEHPASMRVTAHEPID